MQDTLYQYKGDLYHGACMTEALRMTAAIVEVGAVEPDDMCAACDEPLVVRGEEEVVEDEEPVWVRMPEDGDEDLPEDLKAEDEEA